MDVRTLSVLVKEELSDGGEKNREEKEKNRCKERWVNGIGMTYGPMELRE
jgi:hypothetical protein